MMQRHRSLLTKLAVIMAMSSIGLAGRAQLYLPDASITWPGSMSCEMAIPFCSSVRSHFDHPEGPFFIWYTFEVTATEVVGLLFESDRAETKYELYKAADPDDPCGTLVDVFLNHDGYSYYYEGTLAPGRYYIRIAMPEFDDIHVQVTAIKGLGCGGQECAGCLPPFSPIKNKEYVLNAWVKLDGAAAGTINYAGPKIKVEAPVGTVVQEVVPVVEHPVVDGWQLMEDRFTMPMGAEDLRISLECDGCTAFYDDVRVFPADGSMKCYVYDPRDLRFVAELDERHFATRYEYDKEGKLMRVKKETERGVMTLQETQQSNFHVAP